MAILHFQLDSYGHPANLGRTLREFGQQIHIAVASESATMPVDLDETHGVIVSGGGASTGASTAAIEAWVRGAAAAHRTLYRTSDWFARGPCMNQTPPKADI